MSGRPIGDAGFAYLDRVMKAAIERSDELSDFQCDFATTTADRLDRFGRNVFMSGKQWDVVAGIAKKLDLPDPPEDGYGTAA